MSELASLADDDNTGRVRAILTESGSDPARDIKAIRIALDLHERRDRTAIRIALLVASTMIASAAAMLGTAWTSATESGRAAERMDQLVRDVARIDARIERLDDRVREGDR